MCHASAALTVLWECSSVSLMAILLSTRPTTFLVSHCRSTVYSRRVFQVPSLFAGLVQEEEEVVVEVEVEVEVETILVVDHPRL